VDRKLPDKLKKELPGILRWMVEGCLKWQKEGLGIPGDVESATPRKPTLLLSVKTPNFVGQTILRHQFVFL
jgi:hypothetical protein